jgi:ribonuclease HII
VVEFFTATEIEILNSIPNASIIKGDSKFMSIAAASVLARTYRDEYGIQFMKNSMYNGNRTKAIH